MRYRGRVDANQAAITKALRQLGVSVEPIHTLGKGKPDLLCGWRGINLLLEVKDGEKPPSERQLTPAEQEFKDGWRGQYAVVESVQQAVRCVMSYGI